VGWRKWTFVAVAVMLGAPVAAGAYFRVDRAIRVATGAVAHNVCTKTFVSGLDPHTVFSEIVAREGIRRLQHVLRFHVDRDTKTVDASVAGLLASQAPRSSNQLIRH
jgi:hypothetical protein